MGKTKNYASEFWWSIFQRTFHFAILQFCKKKKKFKIIEHFSPNSVKHIETAEIDIYVISLKEYTFVLWWGKQGVIYYMHIDHYCIYFMIRRPCVWSSPFCIRVISLKTKDCFQRRYHFV